MPAAGTGKPGKAGPEGKGGSFGAPSERTDAGKEALQPALLTGPREFALAGIGDLGVCHACRCNAVIGGDVGRANQTGNLDIFIAASKRELLLPAHQHRALGARSEDRRVGKELFST